MLSQETKESNLGSVEQQIKGVQRNQNMMKVQKKQMIKSLLEKEFIKEIKNDNTNLALELLRGPMTLHFQNVDKFSTYFLELPSETQPHLGKFLAPYFSQTREIMLPKHRITRGNFCNEIWFVRSNGYYTVAADKSSKLIIIKDEEIVTEKERTHSKYITVVKWIDANSFCTAGADARVKIWNHKLECLRTILHHQRYVSSVAFSSKYIISAGHDNFILLTQKQSPQKTTKMISQCVQDLHYLFTKSKLLTLTHSRNRSVVHFYCIQKLEQQKFITLNQRVFYLQPSYCQNYLYLNCKNQQIHMYDTNTLTLKRKFSGFFQQTYLMRMSSGGPNDQYLAVPSQKGEVVFFHSSRSQPVGHFKLEQQTVINCVAWVNKYEVVVGCDNGEIQRWAVQDRPQTTFRRSDTLSTRAQQLFRNIVPGWSI